MSSCPQRFFPPVLYPVGFGPNLTFYLVGIETVAIYVFLLGLSIGREGV